MSNIVPAFSTRQFTLTAGEAISVYSQGAFKVTQLSGFTNFPTSPIELVDRPANGLAFTSSTFANGAVVEVDCYGGQVAYCEDGTAPVVKQGQAQSGTQVAAIAINVTTNPITPAQLLNGRITSTTAAAVVLTVPTGTLLYAATTWLPGEYFDWTLTNTGANLLSLALNTDHTLVGGAANAVDCPTLTSVACRTTLISVTAAGVGTFVTQAMARPVT
jgi:hypothetical protein